MAIEDNTRAEVLAKVGVEPTSDAFNAISLEPGTGRPRNPRINADAIATVGMIAVKTTASRLQRILQTVSLYSGRDVAAELAHWPGKSPMRFGIRQRAADWDNAQSEKSRGARSFSLKAVHAFSQNGRAANQTDRRLSPSAARGQAEAL